MSLFAFVADAIALTAVLSKSCRFALWWRWEWRSCNYPSFAQSFQSFKVKVENVSDNSKSLTVFFLKRNFHRFKRYFSPPVRAACRSG